MHRPTPSLAAALALAFVLAGCVEFPELDAVATPGIENAPYPALLPLGDLDRGPTPEASARDAFGVEGRVAGLRGRAERLAGAAPGPQPDLRARMDRLRARAETLRAQ